MKMEISIGLCSYVVFHFEGKADFFSSYQNYNWITVATLGNASSHRTGNGKQRQTKNFPKVVLLAGGKNLVAIIT